MGTEFQFGKTKEVWRWVLVMVAQGFPGGSVVKNLPASTGDIGSIPGSERSPGGRNCNLLQYPSPENPVDRGAWQATVHRVVKSQTRLKRPSTAQ